MTVVDVLVSSTAPRLPPPPAPLADVQVTGELSESVQVTVIVAAFVGVSLLGTALGMLLHCQAARCTGRGALESQEGPVGEKAVAKQASAAEDVVAKWV